MTSIQLNSSGKTPACVLHHDIVLVEIIFLLILAKLGVRSKTRHLASCLLLGANRHVQDQMQPRNDVVHSDVLLVYGKGCSSSQLLKDSDQKVQESLN